MRQRWTAIGVILLLSFVFFPNVSFVTKNATAAEPTGTLADIINRGYIKVGSDISYPPFEEYNATTGIPEGFDIDIMHVLAKYINETYNTSIAVRFINSAWDPIIPNLQQKQFDVICSAMTITAARELEVDFTRWYYQSSQGILVQDENPKGILTTADLNDTNLNVGVQTGTTSYIWATEIGNITATVMTYDDFPTAIAALKIGTVDAVLGDIAVLNLDAATSGETEVVHSFSPENFGIACRNGDNDLRAVLNAGLIELLGSNESDPVISDLYNAIYYKWHSVSVFGYTGTVTDTEIPYNWWVKEDEDGPGFGIFITLMVLLSSVIVLQHRRKNN